MKEHILVTGGSGFIGSAIVSSCLKAGYTVSSVSRNSDNSDNSNNSKQLFSVDLTDILAVSEFVKNSKPVDIVIHCAAIAHGEKPPKNYTVAEFNSKMVVNLLSTFSGKQPHWIFLSSIAVYGDAYCQNHIPLEVSPLSSDDYGRGKLFDEYSLLKACSHLDILRLMPTYETYDNKDIKKRIFIPKTQIKLRILPAPEYSLCHINTVVEKVSSCLGQIPSRRLHQVGDQLSVSQRDLLNYFLGSSIVVPQIIFKSLLLILPYRVGLFSKVRLMIKKLGLSNTYELGVIELSER